MDELAMVLIGAAVLYLIWQMYLQQMAQQMADNSTLQINDSFGRKVLIPDMTKPVRFNASENCYDPYCTDTRGKPAGERTVSMYTDADQKLKDFYQKRADDEHVAAHLMPVYGKDTASTNPAAPGKNDSNVCDTKIYMRKKSNYPHHNSVGASMVCRDC
jgi:hypothetical protein